MRYFDYEQSARQAGVPDKTLAEWREGFENEYPGDEMMVELRLLRACQAAMRGPEYLGRVTRDLAEEFAAMQSPTGS